MDYKKNFSRSQKWHFSKGVNLCFSSKNAFFRIICFRSKKGLEIRFNDVLDRTETFFDYKNKISQRLKNPIFPKDLTHAFRKRMQFFSIFVFGQNKTRKKKFRNVLDRKKNFF